MTELDQARQYFHLTDDDMKQLDKKVIQNWIAENEKSSHEIITKT